MIEWYRNLVEDSELRKEMVYRYIVITVICALSPILGSFIGSLMFLGCNHTLWWYPIMGMFTSIDLGYLWLARMFFGMLFLCPLILLAGYLVAVFKKKYLLLTAAALLDEIISAVFAVCNIVAYGFKFMHVLMFIGLLFGLAYNIYFVSICIYSRSQRKRLENP